MRATLHDLEAAGATVEYHALDVRDRDRFGALVDDLYARHGRIDLVVHGAGVIEDKLLTKKTRESFLRVVETKAMGALTLLEKLRPDVRRVVFFSSVAGAFGNRGQADYAAANDLLDTLAACLDRRIEGRAFSVAWGPWAGGGMVSSELEAEYRRRGIGLIDPEEGVEGLLAELAAAQGPAHVVWMCADPDAFA